MKRVTGLGGVFFKCKDPQAMYAWYQKRLGVQRDSSQAVSFRWREERIPRKRE